MNYCLTTVNGKYVAHMDTNDRNIPECLEAQVEFYENYPDVICVETGMVIIDDEGVRGKYLVTNILIT